MKKLFILFVLSISLVSCSPLYTLFVQNNSDKPVEVYVELKNEKYNQSFKNVIEKRSVYNYKRVENISQFDIDSIRYYLLANRFSEKKLNFTSPLNYNFILESKLSTIVDPSNSISIYPFEKVYYVQDDHKCFIVPERINKDCSYKISNKQKLKKNNSAKKYAGFIEIENLK